MDPILPENASGKPVPADNPVETQRKTGARPELSKIMPCLADRAPELFLFHRSTRKVSAIVHATRASCQDAVLADHDDRIVRAERLIDHMYAIGLLRGMPELRKPGQSERRDGFGRRLPNGGVSRDGESAA